MLAYSCNGCLTFEVCVMSGCVKGEVIMVDNQHQKITGYRDLSLDEIEMMNSCKELAVMCGDTISDLDKVESIDKRWLAIAKTDLQKGFMSLVRSIAKPTTFIFAAFLLSSCSVGIDLTEQLFHGSSLVKHDWRSDPIPPTVVVNK